MNADGTVDNFDAENDDDDDDDDSYFECDIERYVSYEDKLTLAE
jgi:hypothetical protein